MYNNNLYMYNCCDALKIQYRIIFTELLFGMKFEPMYKSGEIMSHHLM